MKKLIILGLIIIFLTGCLPQPTETAIDGVDIVATLVAATLTAEPQSKENPDLTAVASVSTVTPDPADAATNTPTTVPTFTPTYTPTNTPTVTSTPTDESTPTRAPEDPVLSLGVPSVKDTFDSGSIIYQYDESQSSFQVDDNKFVLIAKKSNGYETWSLSWEELTNFYLEITGAFGDECGGKDRYGMIFRAPDTSEGYLISISCDGSFRLSSWESEDEEYTVIKSWTSSDYINSGPGGENRLGVKVKGEKITGFINGHQVFELNDGTFTKGRFGVLVAASNTAGFTAYLTQVVYWKLP
jgi:hypothetical protein